MEKISRGLTTTTRLFAAVFPPFLHPQPLYERLRPGAGNAGRYPRGGGRQPTQSARPSDVRDFAGAPSESGPPSAAPSTAPQPGWTRWSRRREASKGAARGRAPPGLTAPLAALRDPGCAGGGRGSPGRGAGAPEAGLGRASRGAAGMGGARGVGVNVRPAPPVLTQFHQKLREGGGWSPPHRAPGRKRRPERRRK